jgi:sigma-E factor negative regulatory protein RseC
VLLLTGDELWAALGGLLALVPYYGILWLFRQKVRDRLAFQIE